MNGMIVMKTTVITIICVLLALVGVIYHICLSLQPQRNDVDIIYSDPNLPASGLRIAVLGDVHIGEDEQDYVEFSQILDEVRLAKPDLILFVGDYTAHPRDITDMGAHRERILKMLNSVAPTPFTAVLGNYETWSRDVDWYRAGIENGIPFMLNEVQIIGTRAGQVCVRGLGDAYTKRFRYVEFPISCDGLPKLSITHDPAGAFDSRMKGLIIAGHTHCGQVSFQFIGPLWVPTRAPREAYCGLYQDDQRTLFVTSGIGTSVLPIRFGTKAEWDLLEVH